MDVRVDNVHRTITMDLARRLRKWKLLRTIAGFVLLGVPAGWFVLIGCVQLMDHGPERGTILLPIVYYGLFGSPLLLIPITIYFVASRRCQVLEWRLMFSSSDATMARDP